jgi:3-phytase
MKQATNTIPTNSAYTNNKTTLNGVVLIILILNTILISCQKKPPLVEIVPTPVEEDSGPAPTRMDAHPVVAYAETHPVASQEDAADDPAIWIHPTQPDKSLIIGTDKNSLTGGLYVYDLLGSLVSFTPDPAVNNVDIRQNIPLADGSLIDLVVATRRSDSSLAIYALNSATRSLRNVEGNRIITREVYGGCLYHSSIDSSLYFFITTKTGVVEQWKLVEQDAKFNCTKVDQFKVESQTEGCVADDELGILWLGEEGRGLWKFKAEPTSNLLDTTNLVREGVLVDTVGGGNLAADVEGVALYYQPNGEGYIMASSQGDNTYAIYQRKEPHAYVGNIRIAPNGEIGSVEETDGIEVTSQYLGEALPMGILVVQDGFNEPSAQNFKFVDWQQIEQVINPK